MKIGFIGLGNMGFGMASNLIKVGTEVIVFDLDDEKLNELVKIGAEKANSIQKIGKVVKIVILCLPHPDISKDVIFNNLLSSENKINTIIDTSTLTPKDSIEIYNSLQKQSVNFLCAPMLGGKNAALNKKIHFLVEGEKDVFTICQPLFMNMGSRVDYMGASPSATLAKLAYNMCRYSNLATAAEVARFLRSYTTETQSIYNLLVEGSHDNFGQVWKEDIKKMMLDGTSYKPSNIPQKDLTLIVDLQKKQKLSEKLFESIKEVYKSLMQI